MALVLVGGIFLAIGDYTSAVLVAGFSAAAFAYVNTPNKVAATLVAVVVLTATGIAFASVNASTADAQAGDAGYFGTPISGEQREGYNSGQEQVGEKCVRGAGMAGAPAAFTGNPYFITSGLVGGCTGNALFGEY